MAGRAKRDLATLLTYLREGYVLVEGSGIGWYRADKLSDQGYNVAAIYPPSLESANSKWFEKLYRKLREARRDGR